MTDGYDPSWNELVAMSEAQRIVAAAAQHRRPDDMPIDEWIIEVTSRRHIAAGKTVAEARKIVIEAFSRPFKFPRFEDL